MLDPFGAPPPFLMKGIQPLADSLGLSTFPLHIHEIIFACTFYAFFNAVIGPAISTRLFPNTYPHFSRRTKLSWDTHATSLLQCLSITALALFVFSRDEERREMGLAGRIWGYSGAIGAVQGLVEGYFCWDLIFCVLHYRDIGPGDLLHAISVLIITSLGFRPFANYYGLNFILYEISNPFMNLHWFFDKVNMTGSWAQFYNGIVLLVSFFCCRILWGTYQTVSISRDLWMTLTTNVDPRLLKGLPVPTVAMPTYTVETFAFPGTMTLPSWLVLIYLGGNTALTFLNVYWFSLMVKALRKRFRPGKAVQQNGSLTKAGLAKE
ncbi:MAG: hypothetical protein M1818_001390 [Claussenomyces sp. TS43310]|nr:MAG: hypothetical protein M1818_001390 [Claussenomyces sp. TS43310]